MQIQITDFVVFLTIISLFLAIVVSVIRIFYYKERMETLDETKDTEEIDVMKPSTLENYTCPLCKGNGIYRGKTCKACEGVGMFKAPPDSVVCGTCKGKGQIEGKRTCPICKGRGRVPSFTIRAMYEDDD